MNFCQINLKIVFVTFLSFLLVACANHSATSLRSLDNEQGSKTHTDSYFTVRAKIITNNDKHLGMYSEFIENGIMPVQLSIDNLSDINWRFHNGSVTLQTESGQHTQLEIDNISSKVNNNYSTTAAWTILFGGLGLLGSISNVAESNIRILDELNSKRIKSGILQPGEMAEGLLYFEHKNKNVPSQAILKVKLFNKETSEYKVIKINIL